jgi:hypothetical protein
MNFRATHRSSVVPVSRVGTECVSGLRGLVTAGLQVSSSLADASSKMGQEPQLKGGEGSLAGWDDRARWAASWSWEWVWPWWEWFWGW